MRLAFLLGAGLLLATSAATHAYPLPLAAKPDVHVHVATAASFRQQAPLPKHVLVPVVCPLDGCASGIVFPLCRQLFLPAEVAVAPHVHASVRRVVGPDSLPATPPPRRRKY